MRDIGEPREMHGAESVDRNINLRYQRLGLSIATAAVFDAGYKFLTGKDKSPEVILQAGVQLGYDLFPRLEQIAGPYTQNFSQSFNKILELD